MIVDWNFQEWLYIDIIFKICMTLKFSYFVVRSLLSTSGPITLSIYFIPIGSGNNVYDFHTCQQTKMRSVIARCLWRPILTNNDANYGNVGSVEDNNSLDLWLECIGRTPEFRERCKPIIECQRCTGTRFVHFSHYFLYINNETW